MVKAARSKKRQIEEWQRIGSELAPEKRALLTRNMRFLTKLISTVSTDQLADAIAASRDYETLAQELSLPDARALQDDGDPWAELYVNGFEFTERLLRAEGGCVSAGDLARQLHISRQGIDQRRRRGLLLGINIGRRAYAYPRWQFKNGRLLHGLAEVLRELRKKRIEGVDALAFFLNPNLAVKGLSPLEGLRRGLLDDVMRAASLHFEQGPV